MEGQVTDIEQRALEFATLAHFGQFRKYTGEPYIVHPVAVAEIVRGVRHTPEMIAAAYLHDVVEDCNVKLDVIDANFGHAVRTFVDFLTDVSMPWHGNRATQKRLDREHISKAPPAAQTIKLADLIDNTKSIKERDPGFWKVYRLEKIALLDVIDRGDPELIARARLLVAEE
jgi:(p)ppGpp synthase/HD superfamily hydrolase